MQAKFEELKRNLLALQYIGQRLAINNNTHSVDLMIWISFQKCFELKIKLCWSLLSVNLYSSYLIFKLLDELFLGVRAQHNLFHISLYKLA